MDIVLLPGVIYIEKVQNRLRTNARNKPPSVGRFYGWQHSTSTQAGRASYPTLTTVS